VAVPHRGFVFPQLAFIVTRRICFGLQRKDRDLALHGRQTGRVVRTAEGEFYEVHEPISDIDRWLLVQHEQHRPLELDSQVHENGVAKPNARSERVRQAVELLLRAACGATYAVPAGGGPP